MKLDTAVQVRLRRTDIATAFQAFTSQGFFPRSLSEVVRLAFEFGVEQLTNAGHQRVESTEEAMNIFPPGLFLISIPFQLIPTVLENLEEMPVPQGPLEPGPGGDAHRKRVNQLMKDMRERIKE